MATIDNPLEPEVTESGLATMPPIDTEHGSTLQVHDSSSIEPDEVWFVLEGGQVSLDGEYRLAVPMVDALTFARHIIALGERRGYHLDPADDEPDATVIDNLMDELDEVTAKLNAAVPDRSELHTRSDEGDILELGAYLATLHTAAALAEDIPRRIAALGATAYAQEIGHNLDKAAQTARERIRDLALGDHTPEVFPPCPYLLRGAVRHLEGVQAEALALYNRAGIVIAEVECYREEPEPDPMVEDLLTVFDETNAEPESDRAPGCQCTDGNCDKCLHYRQTTESE